MLGASIYSNKCETYTREQEWLYLHVHYIDQILFKINISLGTYTCYSTCICRKLELYIFHNLNNIEVQHYANIKIELDNCI